MADYSVNRAVLEEKSTEEILEILKHERDDYTPEAIEIFEDILAKRGHTKGASARRAGTMTQGETQMEDLDSFQVNNPQDAIVVLNYLLQGVMDGSIDLQKAQVASNLVLALLGALEREFMSDHGEPPITR